MRILILSQYFPPEVGAPQNRLFEMAVLLNKKGMDVHILTAMPNYPQMTIYEGYKGRLFHYEEMEGLKVYRSWIYASNKRSVFHRLLNYFSFVFSSMLYGLFRLPSFDYIICESPPLFLFLSAYVLKKTKRSKLVTNISDLWPESAEKLNIISNRFLLKVAYGLEALMYKKSEIITGQTRGIVNNITGRFPGKKVFWIPNGSDFSFYDPSKINSTWRNDNFFTANDLLFFYGGIIGHAQGLEIILKSAKHFISDSRVKFVIMGSGPEKQHLLELKEAMKLNNVFFYDPVPKNQMPFVLKDVDACIVPLKKTDIFLGAIPSKIFECCSMKKPILLGVKGESKELFVNEGDCAIAFEPENESELNDAINKLVNSADLRNKLGENGRRYVMKNFNREDITNKLYEILLSNNKPG